jgi:retron-type reverse transcriptase
MQTLDNVFSKIYDFEELYDAHLNARKGKRFRDDVLLFTDNLEENLIQLQNELIWGTYKVGHYRQFYVKEPKLRLVMALQYRDRVVQWAIYKQLNPFYDRTFIEDSYACRIDKGSHKAADRLQYWLRQVSRKPEKWYYLKLDISKYFYRVDHEILLEILGRRIKDKQLMLLLEEIVNSEETKFGLPAGYSPEECTEEMWLSTVGMPIGNLTSQLFANIYLNELDQHCKHQLRLHYYIRYMDDVIILFNDKTELRRIKEDIEIFLKERLRLDLNKKTTIRPISLGIDFVGYKMWATHRKLKKQTARRMIHSVKKLSEMLDEGEITREHFDRSAASFCGTLMHCNSFGLRRKLNHIFDEIVVKGGDGNVR